jgi:putative pyruvate formate lyase activating enzyme
MTNTKSSALDCGDMSQLCSARHVASLQSTDVSAHSRFSSRSALARERAALAHAALSNCRLCAHECGVNRLGGEPGLCRSTAEARFFSAQIEVTDELELIPTFAIALSGCDLRCDFCITGKESWNPRAGEILNAEKISGRAIAALANGAQTIMILGGEPTIHLPSALEIVARLPDDAKLVWKTNAHGSAQARELLDGMFDVWLADYKFGNDDCARRLAKISDYTRVVRENLLWFAGINLTTKKPSDEEKLCCLVPSLFKKRGKLIVRHLLMPGHIECCWRPIAEWLAENMPGVKVNLRSGFWPAWRASRHSELRGTVSKNESEVAWQIARELNLNLVE